MEKIKVIIAENDEKQRNELVREIEKHPVFSIVGETGDGREAIHMVMEQRPELFICNMILRSYDAAAILDELRKRLHQLPKVIVVSSVNMESCIAKAFEKGADEYMLKPLNWGLMLHRISELLDRPDLLDAILPTGKASSADCTEEMTEEERIRQNISSLFLRIGIPAHLLGFRFAQDAIAMLVDDPMLMKNRTKVLYPVIAERHHTSAFCVERAIRHVIALTWERGIAERYRKERGGSSLHLPLDRPTSGEFIALMAEYFRPRRRSRTAANNPEH
jgi:two-component system response regulator (stage 0 sporulation protein A)